MLGPDQNPIYFCMNQFQKIPSLEITKFNSYLFKNILKNRGNMKIACQKEK